MPADPVYTVFVRKRAVLKRKITLTFKPVDELTPDQRVLVHAIVSQLLSDIALIDTQISDTCFAGDGGELSAEHEGELDN